MSPTQTPSESPPHLDGRRIRVLLGKPGLDGHNRGIKVVARALREAGIEVVYTGIRRTADDIARSAIDEDVDAVGLSSLSGAHMEHFLKVAELLAEAGSDAALFCGGIIPVEDEKVLRSAGYQQVFGPGASTADIVDWLNEVAGGSPREQS